MRLHRLITIILTTIFTCQILQAQELVKIALDNEDRLIIKKNTNGDLQLATPNSIHGNLFFGFESGDNTVSFASVSGINNLSYGNLALRNLTTGSDNIAIGLESLTKNTEGLFNIGFGTSTLRENVTGQFNIAIGVNALYHNVGHNKNIAIGNNALAIAHNGSGIDKNNIAIGYEALTGSSTPASNTGYDNVAIGNRSIASFTTAYQNVAIGDKSMEDNTTGSKNAAVGAQALMSNQVGFNNVAMGFEALKMNTAGNANTAIGVSSMVSNTTGDLNTAIGSSSLVFNTTGSNNVAVGNQALNKNTTGNNNVAIGEASLKNNTTSSNLVSIGYESMFSNEGAEDNTAVGYRAAYSNQNGEYNTVVGSQANYNNNSGTYNTIMGHKALFSNTFSSSNVVIGAHALEISTVGGSNVVVGSYAGNQATGYSNVFIGYAAGYNETENSKLIIDNGGSNDELIYGDFFEEYLTINDRLGIGTEPTEVLEVKSVGEPIIKIQSKDEDTGARLRFRETHESGIDLHFDTNTEALEIESFLAGFSQGDHVTFRSFNKEMDVNGVVNIKASPISNALLLLESQDGSDVMKIDGGIAPVAQLNGRLNITPSSEGTTFPDSEIAMNMNSKFTMNSSGQLLIGKSGVPQKDIHIKQSNSSLTRGIRLEYENGSDSWDTYIDTADDYNFAFNGTLASYIQDGTGTYVTSSDRSLKNNIAYLENTLDKINSMKPASYSYRIDRANTKVYGLIAQELQQIYPEMVIEKGGKLGVAYDYLIPIAIKGIQELSAENETLKRELGELKQELDSAKLLEKRIERLEALLNK